MLLSAGGFAVYLAESNVFNILVPRFGDLSIRKNKQELMKVWLESKLFERTGLNARDIEQKILDECDHGGDFLRIVMEEIATKQNVERWADCTPDHLLYLEEIKKTLPDALVIHILRDGRDVALSLEKQQWIRPFLWDREKAVLVAGFYWEWIVNRGRQSGGKLGEDYLEVHFEDIVSSPRATLARLGEFIQHDLNYDHILRVGLGTVSEPNSSFGTDSRGRKFNPIGRWQSQLTGQKLIEFENLLGGTLQDLGYTLAEEAHTGESAKGKVIKAAYQALFSFKIWLKGNLPLRQWLIKNDLSWL
jgi:hypothetical protein